MTPIVTINSHLCRPRAKKNAAKYFPPGRGRKL